MSRILESYDAMRKFRESDESDEVVLDVVDADLRSDEVDANTNAQNTQPDEVSYLGRYVAICPVCAEPFFCKEEAQIIEGMCHDVCPVCQEEVDAKVIGVVTEVGDEEEHKDDESEEHKDDESEEHEGEEEKVEEVGPIAGAVLGAVASAAAGKVIDKALESESSTNKKAPDASKFALEFDEQAMNKILDQFIKENYKSIKSMRVESVRKRPHQLVIEMKVVTNKNVKKKCSIVAEDFKLAKKMVIEAKCPELGAKSKGDMKILASLKAGKIIPESMKYDYITSVISEGKRVKAQVYGSHKA